MNIKGTAFTIAKASISQAFGEDRWNAFMARMAQKDSFYKNVIMSITPIPIEKHLAFLDEMVKEFSTTIKNNFSCSVKWPPNSLYRPAGLIIHFY